MDGSHSIRVSNDNSDPGWFFYDSQGMILPHSVLGSLDNFRSYVEERGKLGLLEKIPNSNQVEVIEKDTSKVGNKKTTPHCIQTNALKHWNTHMKLRRSQQDTLSGLLRRPAENLLMNHAHHFRETQEKREMLNQVLPLVHSGYGQRVGSGFWRLPQHYGDETSGITSTLTKTERGIREPSAQVGLPSSIRQESGLKMEEIVRDASRAWDQSNYLKQQCQMLAEVMQDVNFKRPDIDKLEVIASCKPFCTETCRNAFLENTNEEEEFTDVYEDMILKSNDAELEAKYLPVPALRISGQLANWTGNSKSNQGQFGINTSILFECPSGELQTSHVTLQNEGSTVIFYTWEPLPLPDHFPHLLPCTKRPHFYFNTASGVILPGETQKVAFSFKSDEPGIQTELWQLNTHPVLLQGAPIQVTLRGAALYQDRTADHRLYIEKTLEKKITVEICRSIVRDVVQGIHTPERPSSPAVLHQTEEQEFLCKNPKMCYKKQPVEELKILWHKIKPECDWDLSVSALRQALLSLPEDEIEGSCLNQDTGLAQLNSLLLQLTEPSPELKSPTVAEIGQLIWRDVVDTMTSEAVRLIHLLHLPEKDTWLDKNENKKEDTSSDQDLTSSLNEEQFAKKAAVEKTVAKSKKEVVPVKQETYKEPHLSEPLDKKKGKGSRSDLGKLKKDKPNKEPQIQLQEQAPEDPALDTNMMNIYPRLLHQQVYGLVENLVDSLCDVIEELRPSADHHIIEKPIWV